MITPPQRLDRASSWLMLALVCSLALAPLASAHHMWLIASPTKEKGKTKVEAGFGDNGKSDKDYVSLLDKARFWFKTPKKGDELALAVDTKQGKRVGILAAQTPLAVFGTLNYGVLDMKNKPTRNVRFYAKSLIGPAKEWKTFTGGKDFPLDLQVEFQNGKLIFTPRYKGKNIDKPEALKVYSPAGEKKYEFENESVSVPAKKPGLYRAQFGYLRDEKGKVDGKEFEQAWDWVTVACTISDDDHAGPGDPQAIAFFNKTRSKRFTWKENFPGFTANLVVRQNGIMVKGKLTVADGVVQKVELDTKHDALKKEVERRISSMVGHRLANTAAPEKNLDITFGNKKADDHAYGRLLIEKTEKSTVSYRVKDGILRVVDRQLPMGRLVITAMETFSTDDGRYLPKYYTVNYYNKDGSLKKNTTVQTHWQKVKASYLPKWVEAVTADKEGVSILRIDFNDLKYLKADK